MKISPILSFCLDDRSQVFLGSSLKVEVSAMNPLPWIAGPSTFSATATLVSSRFSAKCGFT